MGARILIVDDEETILFAMADYFSANGYCVDCAQTQREAEQKLESAAYSVAITDLRLTRDDGAEGLSIAGRIQEHYPDTRCIILTAHGTPEIETAARRRGVDAFLRKPVALSEIARLVSAAAGSPRLQ